MSFSKSIRKKRRHSRKRNMKGGGLPTSMAILSYNTSFVLSKDRLFPAGASENTSIYLRLMKLRSLMEDKGLEQDFIATHYQKLFSMSCKIIAAFLEEHKEYEYCAAALQEMNFSQTYLTTMNQYVNPEQFKILACGVDVNGGTGLAYIIPVDKFGMYMDKVNYANEWVAPDAELYRQFNPSKVAIIDLGVHSKYQDNKFYKDSKGTPDNGRPMTLIVRNESNGCYTLHFNCHIPNPSALKSNESGHTISLLEEYSTGQRTNLTTWAKITHEIINEAASILLLKFFTPEQITTLTSTNCRIIFSGDFNDGNNTLMNLMRTDGLTVARSGLESIPIQFDEAMPESCCSNFNSVKAPIDNTTPPSLRLTDIDIQRANLDKKTDARLVPLLASPGGYDYIVNTTNYAFVGDGTGSNIPLTSRIYDPLIVSGIPTIDYQTLKSSHIRGSDHMPVVSTTIDSRRPMPDDLAPKRQKSVEEPAPELEEDPQQLPGASESAGDTEQLEVSGGYRKKRRSQRKLKQRKSKRHTKKRNYRKNKK